MHTCEESKLTLDVVDDLALLPLTQVVAPLDVRRPPAKSSRLDRLLLPSRLRIPLVQRLRRDELDAALPRDVDRTRKPPEPMPEPVLDDLRNDALAMLALRRRRGVSFLDLAELTRKAVALEELRVHRRRAPQHCAWTWALRPWLRARGGGAASGRRARGRAGGSEELGEEHGRGGLLAVRGRDGGRLVGDRRDGAEGLSGLRV